MTDQLSLADVKADRPGLVRHDHRDTAKQAAAGVKTGSQRARILITIALTDGLTDGEIVERVGMNPSSARPRRVELARDGLIEAAPVTRPSQFGHPMQVWRVTAAGLAALKDAAA